MPGKKKLNKSIKYFYAILLISFLFISYKYFDIELLGNWIDAHPSITLNNTLVIGIIIYFLRFISILIPILPGTYCSILSGYLFGIETGIVLIFLADFISCSCSFLLSRRLGRGFIRKLLGSRQLERIERISKNYMENNFFLMTGLLMTQFFDFVCYAVGLTRITWKKFMPALIVSIIISDAPFVAGGYSIRKIQDINIKDLLNGDIQVLQGPYLTLFVVSVISIFILAILSSYIRKGKDLA